MKYMSEKDLMKKISSHRKVNKSIYYSIKKGTNQNINDNKNEKFLRTNSAYIKSNDEKNAYIGIENYNNIYINSRMTNSFGEIKEGQLEEFYQFEDDFD